MIGFTVTVKKAADINDWATKFPDDYRQRAGKLLTVYGLRIEREAKRETPVKTGTLRRGLHTVIDVTGDHMRAEVGTNIRYGPYVEYGTGLYGPKKKAYEIRPKTKKALAFKMAAATELSSGKALYRKQGVVITKAGWARLITVRAGTKTGLIKSRKAAALTVVAKVIHPGVRPRPYLHPPFERLAPQFFERLCALMGHFNFPGAPG